MRRTAEFFTRDTEALRGFTSAYTSGPGPKLVLPPGAGVAKLPATALSVEFALEADVGSWHSSDTDDDNSTDFSSGDDSEGQETIVHDDFL